MVVAPQYTQVRVKVSAMLQTYLTQVQEGGVSPMIL